MTYLPLPRPTFDRGGLSLTSHDPRNRAFPVRALLSPAPIRDRSWRRWRPIQNQGRTSSCVGQAFVGLTVTRPHYGLLSPLQRRAIPDPYDLYLAAQGLDDFEGAEPTYQGTSTLAGAKAAKAAGLIREYRWCFGIADVIDALNTLGPVTTGLDWTMAMARPMSDGRPDPGAGEAILGGHETCLVGIDAERKEVLGVNSWGSEWSVKGRFRWSWKLLEERLAAQGDACVGLVA